MERISPIVVPQLNVNDDTALLVKWLVEDGAGVNSGDAIYEAETSKAVVEVNAEDNGVILRIVSPQSTINVGERIGLIGPSLRKLEAYLSEEKASRLKASDEEIEELPAQATPRARALAEKHGVSLEEVKSLGVKGVIKEGDVKRYLSKQLARADSSEETGETPDLPGTISRYVVKEGDLPRHDLSVSRNLKRSMQNVLLASIDAVVDLTSINDSIRKARERGTIISLLHITMSALGRLLPDYPRLISFHQDRRLYRYREINIAFVVRTKDGRLYTPVVPRVDELDVKQIAEACLGAAVRVNRGHVKPEDLEGACFTVSHIPLPVVSRFVALPNSYQSAILAIAGEQETVSLKEGKVVQKPVTTLTLSYDHTVFDGISAADFLSRLVEELEVGLE